MNLYVLIYNRNSESYALQRTKIFTDEAEARASFEKQKELMPPDSTLRLKNVLPGEDVEFVHPFESFSRTR
jgi:hypothetical protein